jgi:PiT family inorganic phosphate transporter
MLLILVILIGCLSFANGANDNCKGVATLVGFGAARPRQALVWAAVTTAAGAAISFWLADALVNKFSRDLFAAGVVLDTDFFAAALFGAFGWVILATVTGMPVSTTHALTGALVGCGLVELASGSVAWSVLTGKFLKPLALSPLLSTVLVFLLAWPVGRIAKRYATQCVCVADPAAEVPVGASAAAVVPGPLFVTGTSAECRTHGATPIATTSSVANGVHWLTSGLVGLARGWNDAPKIAALGIVAISSLAPQSGRLLTFLLVTVTMAAGGLVAGTKVLRTLAKKLTPLPLAESLTASMTTATLVSLASWIGLPVSTTHVSTGAIIGAGLKNNPRSVRWGKVGEVLLSWLVTLPVAGVLAAGAKYLLARLA